jgi:hypothetical protein
LIVIQCNVEKEKGRENENEPTRYKYFFLNKRKKKKSPRLDVLELFYTVVSREKRSLKDYSARQKRLE